MYYFVIAFIINQFSSDVSIYLIGPSSSVMENKPFVQLCAKMEGVAERAVSIFVDVSPGSAQSKWINDPNTTTVQLQILPY